MEIKVIQRDSKVPTTSRASKVHRLRLMERIGPGHKSRVPPGRVYAEGALNHSVQFRVYVSK